MELEREIARQNTFGKEEEARKLYLKLKEQLSDQWKENRQYKKYMNTLFANQLGEISEEDAIRECEIVRRRIEIGTNCISNFRLLPILLCSHTGNCIVQEEKLQLLVALFQ